MEKSLFQSRFFKAYMRLDYVNPRYYMPLVECMLISVNFEDDTVKLRPIIGQESESFEVEEKDFWCSIDYIEFPKKKMSILK